MSKVIVVGHKSVELSPLNSALESAGVLAAEYSSKSPQEIDRIISSISKGELSIPTIWNGLALDLLVDNVHNPIWGWSNPDALYSLEYWKNVDPEFTFILSYENPVNMLLKEEIDVDLDEKLQQWAEYHKKLLQFYLDNRESSILIHQMQFNTNIRGAMLLLESGIKGISYNEKENKELRFLENIDPVTYDVMELESKIGVKRFILDSVMREFPDILDLYEKIQAVSDLPLEEPLSKISPIKVWQSFAQAEQERVIEKERVAHQIGLIEENRTFEKKELEKNIIEVKEEKALLLGELHAAQEEVEVLFGKHSRLIKSLNEKEQKLIESEERSFNLLEVQKETEKSLSEVQSEHQHQINIVKKLSIEKRDLESDQQALKQQFSEIKIEFDKKVSSFKENSEKKIESIQSEIEKENFELLQQMHFLQEELETFYLNQKKLEFEKKVGPFGAGDRIKSQLGYRVGATLITNSKSFSGCVLMPFKLTSTYKSFKQESKNQSDLPAIDTYQDYYDVVRVQGHLSYRLGNYFVNNIKKPWKWLVMPWQMRKIVKSFRLENK